MTARAGHASSPLRQLTTLAALLEHITASSVLDGAILLGSGVRLASPYRVVTATLGLPSGSPLARPSSAPSWASTCIPLNAPTTSSRR